MPILSFHDFDNDHMIHNIKRKKERKKGILARHFSTKSG